MTRPADSAGGAHAIAPRALSRARLLDPGLAIAIGLSLLTFVGGLIGLAANVDLMARHREESQARNALHDRVQEVADQLDSNTEWDEAVQATSIKLDLPWIRKNFGDYYSQPGKYEFDLLLGPDGQQIYAMDHNRDVEPGHFAGLSPEFQRLIADVRAQEARRGPLTPAPQFSRFLTTPIHANDVAMFQGRPFVVTATLIQPDFGTVLPGPKAAIIITGMAIDQKFLNGLQRRLLLDKVRLAGPNDDSAASIDLTNTRGQRLARIAWDPRRPGADLLSLALLPILIGVGAPLLLFLNGRRTSRRLAATLTELARARDEADAANEQKSAFLANMSHEIRTPLNGVLAMAQVMELSPLSPIQRERLSVISQSSETLLTIVNDVLDLSKIEAGRLELNPRPFDIAALAQTLGALYAPVAEDKGLAFSIETDPACAGWWLGDPDRLRQVAANLIGNAIKFTEAGEVQVDIRCIEPEGLHIEVRDTGIGVPADKQELIFDKFRQAESATSRRFGGTGLGLSISRQLVELMGGRLWVESRPGAGSNFAFEIPLPRAAEPPAAVAVAPAEPASETGRLRVLAADDNATNRQVLAAILDQLGVELDLRDDGEGAVTAWRAGVYDAILMDIQMPGLDGVAATRMIRAEESASGRPRTPIIALTANAMTHQLAEYRAAGMDDCVAKPIRIVELHAALVRVLEPAGDAAETGEPVSA